jgi:hypothetical protein
MRSALHYPASNSFSSGGYVDWRIPENVSGRDDVVLRRLMRASSRAMPLGGGRDAHLCLDEGFTL